MLGIILETVAGKNSAILDWDAANGRSILDLRHQQKKLRECCCIAKQDPTWPCKNQIVHALDFNWSACSFMLQNRGNAFADRAYGLYLQASTEWAEVGDCLCG